MKLHDFVKIKLNDGTFAWGHISSILGDIVKISLAYPQSGRTGMYALRKLMVASEIEKYLYA